MNISNSISSTFVRFRKPIVYAVVFLVVIISAYWLWHMDKVLSDLAEWCITQKEPQPIGVCWGIAERDIERTYYLKVIMLSILAFGSMALLSMASDKERG